METIEGQLHLLAYVPRTPREPLSNGPGVLALALGTLASCGSVAAMQRAVPVFLGVLIFTLAFIAVLMGSWSLTIREPKQKGKVPRRNWFGILGLSLGVASPVLALVTLQPIKKVSSTAGLMQSAGNLHKIGTAAFAYADAHAGRLPDRIEDLMGRDLPPATFVCPGGGYTAAVSGPTPQATIANICAGGHLSYTYIGKGWKINQLHADVVLAYGTPMPENWGVAALYGDGHTEFSSNAEASRMIAELNAGHNPPR